MAMRRRRLNTEPLCRHCKQDGIVRKAVTPDHIIPIAMGGKDTDDNIQCLCMECHAIKTAYENASAVAASTHPDWLRPSAIPLTIVCGPPCSGKSTLVQERKQKSDIVIDLDLISKNINPAYVPWGEYNAELLRQSLRVRNAILGSLNKMSFGSAWLIVSAPTHEERSWWRNKLDGVIVLLNPGMDECKRRAIVRNTPSAVPAIGAWYDASLKHWMKPNKRIGLDGWPID